jgi:hypothetical protein
MHHFTGRSFLIVFLLLFINGTGANIFWKGQNSSNSPMQSFVKSSRDDFSVLSANLGNSDARCLRHQKRLCRKSVEARITENVKALKPDIVILQESLPPWLCEFKPDTNQKNVCSEIQVEHQVRRILGSDYTIACEPRKEFECIAVHTSAGDIAGCPKGEICLHARSIIPPDYCRDHFTVSAATVNLRNGVSFDIVNMHPPGTNTACRIYFLEEAFKKPPENNHFLKTNKVLAIGDFNFDPWRDTNRSVKVWEKIMESGWAGIPFRYHSGIVETDPPYPTLIYVIRKTFDLAVSNFASGTMNVLGKSPGTLRLDGGQGTDHRAIFGILTIPAD